MIDSPITSLIPQRPPMVMVDTLLHGDAMTATTSFLILPGNIFVEDERLAEPGMIENIAQTAAAMIGYQCALQKIPVPVGFIAAVKDLQIHSLPAVSTRIQTHVVITNTVLNVTIIQGHIEQTGKLLCTCEMKILIKTE